MILIVIPAVIHKLQANIAGVIPMQTLNFLPDILDVVDLSGHTNRIIEDIKKDLAGEYNIPADDIELHNTYTVYSRDMRIYERMFKINALSLVRKYDIPIAEYYRHHEEAVV